MTINNQMLCGYQLK